MVIDKYKRRRFDFGTTSLIVLLFSLPLAVGVVGWITADRTHFTCDTPTVNVEKGDTVWSIARTNCHGDTQAVISRLVDFYGTNLDTWQVMTMPHNR
jgi:hypothetical protein